MISSSVEPVEFDFRLPKCQELPDGEVHVWQADLDALVLATESSRSPLSQDEHQRASRFHFESDRKRYIAGRQFLRKLISAYSKIDFMGSSFHYSPKGKPSLGPASEIRFNVSHSGRIAIFAFVRGKEVGVDVEQIRKEVNVKEIAGRFFSRAEQATFATVAEELKREAFFRCWTRKEAFVKAKGDGLSLPLDQFDVSLLPGESAQLLSTRPEPEEQHRWSMCDLNVGPDYASALVVEGKGASVVEKPTSISVEYGAGSESLAQWCKT